MADEAFEARKLLRAARSGALATTADGGQPFASLVTPACAPDLSLLLLLSALSEHTRYLRAEPRCSVLVTGAAEGVNPQTAPRVTVSSIAQVVDDPALKAHISGGASLCLALRRFRRFSIFGACGQWPRCSWVASRALSPEA